MWGFMPCSWGLSVGICKGMTSERMKLWQRYLNYLHSLALIFLLFWQIITSHNIKSASHKIMRSALCSVQIVIDHRLIMIWYRKAGVIDRSQYVLPDIFDLGAVLLQIVHHHAYMLAVDLQKDAPDCFCRFIISGTERKSVSINRISIVLISIITLWFRKILIFGFLNCWIMIFKILYIRIRRDEILHIKQNSEFIDTFTACRYTYSYEPDHKSRKAVQFPSCCTYSAP